MSIFAIIRVSLSALLVNKGRSILTSLGIVIGITAVIAMVAAGSGARGALDDSLKSVGKNLVLVRPGGKTNLGFQTQIVSLTADDVNALKRDAQLKRMLMQDERGNPAIAESQYLQRMVTTRTNSYATTIVGTVPTMFAVRSWHVAAGRFFSQADNDKAAPVCIIGETVRKKLFPNKRDLRGETVRIESLNLEVIGVLQPKGRAPMGADQDDQIFVPLTTAQEKMAHEKNISVVAASTKSQELLNDTVKRMRTILREKHRLHPGMEDDFQVSSVEEMAKLAVVATTILNALIVVIASISLIVGGIGIMNIMLVSVTERTREIGIRMAVGATPANIRNQFLIEAVVLAMVGGVIGVSLGVGAAVAMRTFLKWPINFEQFYEYIGLAFGVAAAVGVFFGFYPAAKAAQLDPIDALRYE